MLRAVERHEFIAVVVFIEEDKAVAALMAAYPAWSAYGQDWRQRIANGQSLIAELCAQARDFNQGTV